MPIFAQRMPFKRLKPHNRPQMLKVWRRWNEVRQNYDYLFYFFVTVCDAHFAIFTEDAAPAIQAVEVQPSPEEDKTGADVKRGK